MVSWVAVEKRVKQGHILVPKPDRVGESQIQIQAAASDFQTFLGDQKDKRDTYYLYFVVRTAETTIGGSSSDDRIRTAYRVFREARQLAWTAGWRVGWYPLDKGTTIPIGPAPRSRRSPTLN